jgi:hypothetical protein
MNTSLTNAGFKVTNDLGAYKADEELENLASIEKKSFKDIFEEYAKIRENKSMYNLGI